MRMTASWFGPWTYRIQGCGAIQPRPKADSPLIVIPTVVLEAVRVRPGEIEPRTRDGKNASPCLTQKAPYKGPGADSEEKREPASDIDTAQVNSLKVLDPEWKVAGSNRGL